MLQHEGEGVHHRLHSRIEIGSFQSARAGCCARTQEDLKGRTGNISPVSRDGRPIDFCVGLMTLVICLRVRGEEERAQERPYA